MFIRRRLSNVLPHASRSDVERKRKYSGKLQDRVYLLHRVSKYRQKVTLFDDNK